MRRRSKSRPRWISEEGRLRIVWTWQVSPTLELINLFRRKENRFPERQNPKSKSLMKASTKTLTETISLLPKPRPEKDSEGSGLCCTNLKRGKWKLIEARALSWTFPTTPITTNSNRFLKYRPPKLIQNQFRRRPSCKNKLERETSRNSEILARSPGVYPRVPDKTSESSWRKMAWKSTSTTPIWSRSRPLRASVWVSTEESDQIPRQLHRTVLLLILRTWKDLDQEEVRRPCQECQSEWVPLG